MRLSLRRRLVMASAALLISASSAMGWGGAGVDVSRSAVICCSECDFHAQKCYDDCGANPPCESDCGDLYFFCLHICDTDC